jgi:hypothetical protein
MHSCPEGFAENCIAQLEGATRREVCPRVPGSPRLRKLRLAFEHDCDQEDVLTGGRSSKFPARTYDRPGANSRIFAGNIYL